MELVQPNQAAYPLDPGRAVVRWIVYCHLVAVAICTLLSLSDRSLLINHTVSRVVFVSTEFLIFPAVVAWILCPTVLLIAIGRGTLSRRATVIAVSAEILLSIAQTYAILPSVC